ncbi:cytochrome P450 703A2-like [Nicotiana tabacum]|uniref:Cytochrome P450 703A2-like n=2 Tax=Nicotiana TaxID=4085 RepID=A0A1S3ZPE0_TOBAC|nr:PREDICTED: cytochrome P450 703A2 [Nicotiana sylvestris]XP_016466159.1 PREDICTED: cytochrome P450 703A2-like [Nicotiana tabacum]
MIDLTSFILLLLCTCLFDLINCVVAFLCAYLISKLVHFSLIDKSKQKINRLPPGPKQWPIVGNLFQLGQLPHRDMASFCDKYGPLVYLRLGNVDAITTNDPEIIREILVQQDDVFASRPRTLAAVHLAYGCGDVALAPLGPKWKRMRRICMEHLLTTKRLESFVKHRADEAQTLVQDVWTKTQKGETLNLREILGAFSMNNVTRMLLGKQYFGAESAGPQEAKEFMHITHELFWLLGVIYLGDYLPLWRWIDPHNCEKKMREVEKRIDDFHMRIIEEHRKKGKSNIDEGEMDFVDVLLSLPGEDEGDGNGKQHMDDVEIKALIQDMIAAATDTSAVTNEWAMAEVIKHPHVLKKIQEELDIVVGSGRMVTETDLVNLKYLRCVVRETFRMHPAGPFLIPHESIRDTTINGYYIPAKTRVFINTHGLGRNTKIWDNIDEFRPERHSPKDESIRVEISHGADFKILPFSAGKRKCPGAPLGVKLVLMALARLFHCFDWSPPNGLKPEDIDTSEVYGMTMPKAKPLMAVARHRLPAHLYHCHSIK